MARMGPRPRPIAERIWDKVETPDTCWLWTGAKNDRGYGTVWDLERRSRVYVHRALFQLLVGPIPEGLELDHLCRNPGCVNPAHLEPVTHRENVLRGTSPTAFNNRLTHCPAGHPYDEKNTYYPKRGGRMCRECARIRDRARAPRRRAAKAKGRVA